MREFSKGGEGDKLQKSSIYVSVTWQQFFFFYQNIKPKESDTAYPSPTPILHMPLHSFLVNTQHERDSVQNRLASGQCGEQAGKLLHSFIVILFPRFVKHKCEKRKHHKNACVVAYTRGCQQYSSLLQYRKNIPATIPKKCNKKNVSIVKKKLQRMNI